ncbi:MAG: site-specific integrase [Sphingobium sp.]|jgi:integrase|uniref:tyrosine-type recombinase/integrase n=1 Tax=Sphingobium TaxID=165695 RepID=UPI00121F5784|nr:MULTISPECIES: site-specific integrase [Sphingobium]MBA4755065.1 integrase arm-type DNA-binding domain-containing protein [Sphingobium sp.]QWT15473.1 integrase arm-type DNA-binding domain-containing protein [Sphingobium xenophagum]TAJ81058.1 MAG: site-specific integrase [Sphingobium sp.]
MPKKLSNALTPLSVKNAKPGRHADGGGLHLLVKESGARSWVYRFMLNGKSRDIGLGPAGPDGISLANARDARDALRLKVKAGIDPLEERQRETAEALAAAQAAKVAGITFQAVAETYIGANEESWRNDKHRQQWKNTLATYVYPVIGDLPVAEVATSHVLQILEPIWKTKAETASRVRGRMETILDTAKARGYREGENPARWRGHIALILPARSRLTRGHHKAMPYEAISDFVGALRKRKAVAALALEFTILTAARTGEVIGATWDEVELDKAIWTVPASRMKAGKEHRVPLSPRAVEILKSTQGLRKEWMFPAIKGGKMSGMAMTMLLRRMKVDVTVHGFRSGFRDWSAECTGYAHEVAEMALAHTIESKVERAYRRGDLFGKRRRLMDDWATYCATIPTAGANVTPIRKADSM